MFDNFKKNLKKSRLARRSFRVDRELSFQNFQTARTCLVFGVGGAVPASLLERSRAVLAGKVKVEMLILEVGEPAARGRNAGAVYVNEEDVSLSGRFVNARLHEMVHFSYDLLIDLSSGPDSVGDYILRSSRAKCKIGMEREGFQCDIVFEGSNATGAFPDRLGELLSGVKTRDI
ncbi:MAG: hypothetical protein LBI96_03235 [Odoribacteraceae bacterium]|jgi:hypothetical protein|nr:hypothetical protein [Odoribacteraceae bacterium]